ncbi:MAG: chorismate synthase [Candidatus Heimdallarchaeota archaeon]
MWSNSLGKRFVITTFGESHGAVMGAVIDGCPAGLELTEEDIQPELDRRRPGQSEITTPRKESDQVRILSGTLNSRTTGAPICAEVQNTNVDSSFYEKIKDKPRPGHADYVTKVKYGDFADQRGGGRFSGRITIAYVITGAIAKKLLKETLNVEIFAHTVQIGTKKATKMSLNHIKENREKTPTRCADLEASREMVEQIKKAAGEGDSCGGIIECIAVNLPIGLGEPVLDTLDGDLAKAMFAIPAVRAIEFGAGFKAAIMHGSEHNDELFLDNSRIVSKTNYSGGIIGGISTGMPIVFRIAIKPTSTIGKPQRTVDLKQMKPTIIDDFGRHDPCIVPRAVPIVESMTAIVLADHALRAGVIPPVLERCTNARA